MEDKYLELLNKIRDEVNNLIDNDPVDSYSLCNIIKYANRILAYERHRKQGTLKVK